MWTQGTVLGGRYTLTGRVGGGAMGDVWRADDQVLERQVAVKILLPALLDDEAFAARFRREAKVLAGLDHPGIVDVHDYGEEEVDAGTRIAYIVMEFVSGRPLDVLLRERGPLPAAEALGIAAQALDALHAAHRRDVVHRDVKPANLMVGDDGRVTVTDFGIARALSATKLTAAHEVLGTALYIAPESAEGIATLPASDLYSLGVVLHEMLTGECPFGGETLLEIILKHIREPAPPLPEGFPAPVRDLVARALAKRPEDRYPSAAAMADAARRAATGTAGAVGAVADTGSPDGTLQLVAKASAEVPGAESDRDGGGEAPAVPPMPATPPTAAAPAPAPAVVIATATPSGAAATVPQQQRRWRRPGLVFPLVIPVVVASTAGTVLLMQQTPYAGRSNGPAAPVTAVTSGTPAGGTRSGAAPASPSAGASGAVSPSTSTSASTSGQASGGANGGVALPVQQGGGNGGSAPGSNPGSNKGGSGSGWGAGSGSGSQSGAGSGSGSGSGSGPGTGTGSGSGSGGGSGSGSGSGGSGPAAGCGGTGWGAITNVADGLRLGLSSGSPGAGTAAVLGVNTRFGWVAVPNVQEVVFHECNANGLPLGFPYTAAGGGIELAGPTSYGDQTGWVLRQSPRSGAYYIETPYGSVAGKCLTGHGAGNQVTVESCADGLSTQEWRIG